MKGALTSVRFSSTTPSLQRTWSFSTQSPCDTLFGITSPEVLANIVTLFSDVAEEFSLIDGEKKTDSLLETTTDVNSSFIFSSCSLSWTNCPEIIHIITGISM